MIRRLVNQTLGHIPSEVKQLSDTLCGLLPSDNRGRGALGGVTLTDTDTVCVVPYGNSATFKHKSRSACAVVFFQPFGIFLYGHILHKAGANIQKAFTLVGSDAEGFINDLL